MLKLDTIGKIVGLIANVLFVAFAFFMIGSGRSNDLPDSSLRLFYALLIILGGPIPFFFVSSTTTIQLSTAWGKATIAGGYAIAIVAVFIVIKEIPPSGPIWRYVEVRGVPADHLECSKMGSSGQLFMLAPDSKSSLLRAVCKLNPGETVDITIKIIGPIGVVTNIVSHIAWNSTSDYIVSVPELKYQ